MQDMKKWGLVGAGLLVGILVGAGSEYVRAWWTAAPPPAPAVTPPPAAAETAPRTVVVKDNAAERSAAALRQRVAALERELAVRNAEPAQAEPAPPQDQPPPAGGRPSFADRMEQFKKDHPEEYAAMEKRRAEFRQRMDQERQDRVTFLSSVNTQNMTDAQKANHTKLLQNMATMNALWQQREQNPPEPGSEADDAMRTAMRQTMQDLGAQYGQERDYLLQQAAATAGYQGDDVTKFVDYIQKTFQNTSMFGGRGGPPGGR